MGTRCYIAKEEANGLLRFIYCHSGHSPEHMENILSLHHGDEDSVNRLLNAGGITTLHNYPDRQTNENARYARSEAAFRMALAPRGRGLFPIEWAYIWRRGTGWELIQEEDHERSAAHLGAS